jgi:hypothetical protein
MQRTEQLSDSTYLDYKGLKIRKHEGYRKIFGNVTHHIDMDNSYDTMVDLYLKQGGEYRMLPYKLKRSPLCDFYSGDKFFYEDMTKTVSYPFPFVCPLKKVSFSFQIFNYFSIFMTISGSLRVQRILHFTERYTCSHDKHWWLRWRNHVSERRRNCP